MFYCWFEFCYVYGNIIIGVIYMPSSPLETGVYICP